MANLNSVVLIGRLTRDADMRYTNSGMAVSNLSLAVNRRKRQGDQYVDEASFFDVTLFGKTAENLQQYLVKGKEIGVLGELRQNRWEDANGEKRSRVVVIGNNVQLLGGGGNQHREVAGGEYDTAGFEDDIPF